MELVILLIVLAFKCMTCIPTETQAPDLYFHLLQTDGQSSEEAAFLSKGSRRPSPSDHLPIEDLVENKSEIYDPRPNDINVKVLLEQLGQAYDKEYMSIRDPRQKPNKKPLIQFINDRPKGSRPGFLSLLKTARLQDGKKIKLDVSKKERRKLQKFVWSLTFCPVKHSWKYLGIRFWPQWIREGTCTSKYSCSIPEGMMCKPNASTSKTFLRWHCGDFKERSSCKWIPVQYPIITECTCSCQQE